MVLLAQAMSVTSVEQLETIVETALSSPGVFHFGEFLDVLRQLAASAGADAARAEALRKLELFAWGTYEDWVKAGRAPALREEQELKLRQLTLVTLATAHKNELPYGAMLAALEIRDVRELEDLVLRAIYDGVITGKLDQRRNRFRVTASVGRDVPPAQVAVLARTLAAWEACSEALLRTTEQHAHTATLAAEDAQRSRESFEATLKTMRENAQAMLDEDGGAIGMDVCDPSFAHTVPLATMVPPGHSYPDKKRRARSKRDVYQSKDRS